MVHVESRNRSCSVRKISATPDSPPLVAERIDSMYFDFGAASYSELLVPPRTSHPISYLDLRSTLDYFLHDA